MANVILKRTWFGPGGTRYRKSPPRGHTTVRDEHLPFLPRDAVEVGKAAPAAAPKSDGTMLLREADDARAAAQASDDAIARKTVATDDPQETAAARFARELAAEQELTQIARDRAEEEAEPAVSRDTKPSRGSRKA